MRYADSSHKPSASFRLAARGRMGWKATAALIVLGAVLCLPVGAQNSRKNSLERFQSEIAAGSAAMDSVRAQLTAGREKLRELEKKEVSALLQLEQLEKNLSASHSLIVKIGNSVDSLNVAVARLQDSLRHSQQHLVKRQQQMSERLRNMYKTGTVNLFELFFSSRTAVDLLYRVRYFQLLRDYDARIIADIAAARSSIEQHALAIELRRDAQVVLLEQGKAEQSALAKDQKRQKELAVQIQGEKEAWLASVAELEQAQEQLKKLIEQLQKKAARAKTEMERTLTVAFEKRKGTLPWPLVGEIIKPFGRIVHPVYKTVTMSNGIDIKAPKGSPVVCVAPGKVVYAGMMRGLGRFLVVDHFGGYLTVYANLASVATAVDSDVEYGTVLGTIDFDQAAAVARLHFEVRKASESLDPTLWLERM